MYQLSDDTWDEKEIEAAHRVIDSREYTMGARVSEYEQAFAAKFGSKYAVMSNSGSSANLLMMSALVCSGRLKRGDEVIVTAVAWSTTYFPICQCGLKIRFVDIDKETLNVGDGLIEGAITKDTKAVLAVNLLGNPNDYNRLVKICVENGLLLLEDNCESLGALFEGRYAGTFGCMGTFSTYFSHHICTVEGGITLTDDEELYHYMLAVRSHGWTRHLPKESGIYSKSCDRFYESFHFIVPGYNLRPIEMEAAAGLKQLAKVDGFLAQRRKNAAAFKKGMEGRTGFRMQKEVGEPSWFGFSIVLEGAKAGRRDIYVRKFRDKGIEVRPIVAGNFLRQDAVKYLDFSIYRTLEHADEVHENGFFVGNYSKPMVDEMELFFSALDEVEQEAGKYE